MGKIITFVFIVLVGVSGILYVANSTNKSASLEDILSKTPTLIPTSITSPTTLPTAPTAVPVSPTQNVASIEAVMKTTRGDITLSLYPKDAPNAVNNFLSKAKAGFYNNLIFHRVEDWVVQGGDPKGDGTGGGLMPTEINSLPFVAGSLGVARGRDIRISNDSQFFIVKKDADWLYTQYTNFGIVTKGMDVVDKLEVGDKILEILLENQ